MSIVRQVRTRRQVCLRTGRAGGLGRGQGKWGWGRRVGRATRVSELGMRVREVDFKFQHEIF